MKIAFVTGSYPPDVCGVGHYTFRLAESLDQLGIDVTVVHENDWGATKTGSILRRIRSLQSDLVHIQYPTIGFGAHLSPQLLSLLAPCIVTLHEIGQAHVLRRLSLYPFTIRSQHIIITTDHDRRYAARWAPWIRNRSSVIPLGSNIPAGARRRGSTGDDIVYFGMIRPDRGIEDVLALAALAKAQRLPFVLHMIGKPHPNCGDYAAFLRARSQGLPVVWDAGLSDEEVSARLAAATAAYLPYPDGASERRGSLLALLAHGIPTVTTRGAATPASLESTVAFSRNPADAIDALMRILSDNEYSRQLSERGRAYAGRFSWEAIAQQHKQLYEKLLRTR